MREIVFATHNEHKAREVREILGESWKVLTLSDIGCHDDIPETADTLEGNALIKARWVRDRYCKDCFADDTGLMVDALGGAPGVMSARYAGEHGAGAHGHGGFGYDPVFVPVESGVSFAEMSADDKNAISHRGRAIRKLARFLDNPKLN